MLTSCGLSVSRIVFIFHIFLGKTIWMPTGWIPTFIQSYLTVDTGHVFRFDSVFYNLSNDAHPPSLFFHYSYRLLTVSE